MYCYHCMSRVANNASFCTACGKPLAVKASPGLLKPGTVLNHRYMIGEAIGKGGFGITYIGLDMNLDMKVAVKEFFPDGYAKRNSDVSNHVELNYGENEVFTNARQSFLDEARKIAMFSREDAVVDVREFFAANNTAYIVMEYIEGITLSRYLKENGVFNVNDILSRMMPLMQALKAMHGEDVIHRDISPDNIMMTEKGDLKLMDFGSARYFYRGIQRTSSVVLKPGYAPIEQYSVNGSQGPWTDVYGLCATIYKCITGVTPPNAPERSRQDTLRAPSTLGVRISPDTERALLQGMRIEPMRRLQNMDALISAFQNSVGFAVQSRVNPVREEPLHRSQPPVPQPEKKSSAVPIVIAVIAVLLIVGGVVTFFILRNQNKNRGDVSPTAAATVSPTEASTEAPTEESKTVTMPDVAGKKLSDAQSQLEALGLKVEVTRENSDSVAKDYVIRQAMDAGRELQKGDTVMLYVSDGAAKPTEAPQSKPDTPTYDVAGEVENIRTLYYATQADPGKEDTRGDVSYYVKSGAVTKIVCQNGYNSWGYSREYFYDKGKLYFAFIYDGTEEHRLYFKDGMLIRYIDDHGNVTDFGGISCPFESKAKNEAAGLLQNY